MAPFMTERHYDATMEETWECLKHVVTHKYKKVQVDELSKGISFKAGATAFTAGQNFEASAIPAGEGVTVRLAATANMSTNVGNGRAQANVASFIYENVGKFILDYRALP